MDRFRSDSSVPLQPRASDKEPREVLWQSAFWMLMALALNAMLQRSIADLSLPPTTLSWARSSPVVAFADIIITLMWTIAGWIHGVQFWPAFSLAHYYLHQEQEEDYRDLHPNVISAGVVLFVLGPLPQAVKLFGLKGVPFTYTIGLTYVLAYLVDTITVFGQPSDPNLQTNRSQLSVRTVSKLRKLSDWLVRAAIVLQVCWWFAIFLLMEAPLTNPVPTAAIIIFAWWFPISSLIARRPGIMNEQQPGSIHEPHLRFMLALPIVKFFFDLSERYPKYLPFPLVLTGYLVVTLCCCSYFSLANKLLMGKIVTILNAINQRVRRRADSESTHQGQHRISTVDFVSQVFALANLAWGLILYCYIYDSQGTSKPAWTDMLG